MRWPIEPSPCFFYTLIRARFLPNGIALNLRGSDTVAQFIRHILVFARLRGEAPGVRDGDFTRGIQFDLSPSRRRFVRRADDSSRNAVSGHLPDCQPGCWSENKVLESWKVPEAYYAPSEN